MAEIYVDIDGTLAEYDGWKGLEHFGDPILLSRLYLQQLRADGHKIVIWTCRTNLRPEEGKTQEELVALVRNWLDTHLVLYDRIELAPKPYFHGLIDDRAMYPPWLTEGEGKFLAEHE